MGQSLFKTDHLDHLVEPIAVDGPFRDLQWQEDVLFGRQRRYQIEGLEDEADLFAAQIGQLLLIHGRDFETFHDDPAGSRGVETCHAMHQGGFA